MIKTLNGDQAMAHAALSCGVKLVTSYPGSPSSGAVEALIGLTEEQDLLVEWSSNERVALEMGIGASIAGRRALVCTKSVGLNVMVDPLMALNLTPINGGLVILLGDDPGGYGSQNDQDSRPLAVLLEMPLLEPASPAEGYAMMREAFRISEEYHTVVIIRETRSFTKQAEPVELGDVPRGNSGLGLRREPWRYVPVPLNAVEKHRDLHRRMEALGGWADRSPFNPVSGNGTRGVIAAGFAHRKLLDVVGDNEPERFRLLKLGNLFPLPAGTVSAFLKQCEEVLVLEEIEPFLETQIKALAYDIGFREKSSGNRPVTQAGRESCSGGRSSRPWPDSSPISCPREIFCSGTNRQRSPKKRTTATAADMTRSLTRWKRPPAAWTRSPCWWGIPAVWSRSPTDWMPSSPSARPSGWPMA